MKKHSFIILISILLVSTLTQICTDLYTPSLPAIARYFHTHVGQAQLTMTLLMLGVAFSGFIYGPLSEMLGRRYTLLIGILLAIVGNFICLYANSMTILQWGRLIQGCGLGASSCLWRSIFRDTYSGDDLASVSAYLSSVMLFSVILAPILGGFFEHYYSWRLSFEFLLLWTSIVLFMVLFLFKETGQHHGKHRCSFKFIISSYKELLSTTSFMTFTFCSFLTFGGLFAWLTAGPVVLIKGAGIQPITYGLLSILTGSAMALAGALNGKIVKRMGSQVMMQWGWAFMLCAGVMTLLGFYIWEIKLTVVIIPAVLFIFGSTFVFANAFANAFAEIGHIAGYGGSLYSGIQLLGGVVFSAILSHLNTSSPIPLAIMFILSGLLPWLIYKRVIK